MDIMSPEDRVVLWRYVVQADGDDRRALLHAVANDVFAALAELNLDDARYAKLTRESLETLDDAGLFAADSVRRCLEVLHEPEGGIDLLAAEISGLLRDAAGVAELGTDRRIAAMQMAAEWREHVLDRERPEPETISVGDVAAKFGVTTQAVYKWLAAGRIQGDRGPGGSWRIPAAQFETGGRPATTRQKLDALQRDLIALHGERAPMDDEQLAARLRHAG